MLQVCLWVEYKEYKPLLLPSLSLKIVSSSIVPYGENIILRSSSVAFLDIIPINSLRSSEREMSTMIWAINTEKIHTVKNTNYAAVKRKQGGHESEGDNNTRQILF